VLEVLETTRWLRLEKSGRLQPWLGPALRGVVALPFKERVCRQTDSAGRPPKYCAGCPLQRECPYGRTFEPAAPEGYVPRSGEHELVRPFVLAPRFPMPTQSRIGALITVRAIFIGPDASTAAPAFWDAMKQAGSDPQRGLGPDRIPFRVMLPTQSKEVFNASRMELPTDETTQPGVIERVRVRLTSPLILRDERSGKRESVRAPQFIDLLRACLRTLGPLCRTVGTPLPESVFRLAKEAGQRVECEESAFRSFEQVRWSNRTEEHAMIRGVTGETVYREVPRWLLPWLEWGGRLHVGTLRNSGAGSWTVLDEARDTSPAILRVGVEAPI